MKPSTESIVADLRRLSHPSHGHNKTATYLIHTAADRLEELDKAEAVIQKLLAAREALNALDDAIEVGDKGEYTLAFERREAAGLALDTALNEWQKTQEANHDQ